MPNQQEADSLELDLAVQANFIAYLRKFSRLPGVELHEEPDITWFVSTLGAPGNHVVRTRLDPAADMRTRLRSVLDQVGQKADRLDWPLFPGDGPPEVGHHLAALGLEAHLNGAWMVADLVDAPPPPPSPPGLSLRRVADAAMLAVWHQVSAEGYGMSLESIQPYHDAYLLERFNPAGDCIQVIGYVAGEAVTSGTLLCTPEVAGLYDISTPPRFRRRGYGAAVTAWLMETARARGYRYACLLASPAGEPIYRRLGFQLRFRPMEYIWRRLKWE